ncbi:MAG TPA: ABC transporter ATP-binding protein [Stellaceae bacterium]|nr:ABC transporter ATP-binding protein [Stellaceae bacterium]
MILEAQSLAKNFGGVTAVAPLSFSLDHRVTAVIGPNGAGKTTLFNMISGIYPPSSGRIFYRGRDITGENVTARARRGMMRTFQNLQIFFHLSALENVMVGASRHLNLGLLASLFHMPAIRRDLMEARAKAEALMRLVGLEAYLASPADAMPYGALKRLEIARALAAAPELLLLDEPAAGLNPNETAEIGTLIRRIAQGGTTVLLVEHDMKLVMSVSERIIVLDYGKKLAEGTPEEIRANPQVIAAYLGAGSAP